MARETAAEGWRPGEARPGSRASVFVLDQETRDAVRQCLTTWNLEVHPGNILTALERLSQHPPPNLVVVDLDGVPYPAGSIHELASMCEVGSTVIAVGSRDSARFSRDVLLTGVADYLIKPVTPTRLNGVIDRVHVNVRTPERAGRAVGFVGTGGTGTTTLAAAVASSVADQGHYVSVVDLNRVFSPLPFLFDVEVASGFDEILETAEQQPVDPDLLEASETRYSDRIRVYGYRWNPVIPPQASITAIQRVLEALRRRSHWVIVEPDPTHRWAVLGLCDLRLVVSEPTASGVFRLRKLLAMLGSDRPTLVVQNWTRRAGRSDGKRAFRSADLEVEPAARLSFEDSLPDLCDWGLLPKQVPGSMAKPVRSLTEAATDPGDEIGLLTDDRAVG